MGTTTRPKHSPSHVSLGERVAHHFFGDEAWRLDDASTQVLGLAADLVELFREDWRVMESAEAVLERGHELVADFERLFVPLLHEEPAAETIAA